MNNYKSGASWFHNTEGDDGYWIEKAKIDVAVSIDKQLRAKNVNRSSFAERLRKSSAYISKLLRGEENLTIASMVRIARALNCELHIHMAPAKRRVHWIESVANDVILTSTRIAMRSVESSNGSVWEKVDNAA